MFDNNQRLAPLVRFIVTNYRKILLLSHVSKLLIPAKLLLIMLVLAGNLLYSQSATIRGFIYEKESGEPVIFTNAYLLGTSYGSTTDINGYFAITQIPPGSYTLIVTYLGYDTLTEDVSLKANDLIQKKFISRKINCSFRCRQCFGRASGGSYRNPHLSCQSNTIRY